MYISQSNETNFAHGEQRFFLLLSFGVFYIKLHDNIIINIIQHTRTYSCYNNCSKGVSRHDNNVCLVLYTFCSIFVLCLEYEFIFIKFNSEIEVVFLDVHITLIIFIISVGYLESVIIQNSIKFK